MTQDTQQTQKIGINELIATLSIVPKGILIAGPDRLLLYANQEFCNITGYNEAELIGRTCGLLQGAGTDSACIELIRSTLDAGDAFAGEILNYKKSGEAFWNDLIVAPIRDSEEKIVNFVGITRDITVRKAEEQERLSMNRLYRFLFDHVQAGIVLHKANTEIAYANAAAATMLGIRQDEIIGAADSDPRWIFVTEDGEPLPIEEYPVCKAFASKAVVEGMVAGVRRVNDSQLKWLLCSAFPNLDAQGNAIDVLVTFTDITDLKITEDALKKSEERLQLVLRGANDAAWDWNLVSNELYYSPRWWEMLGHVPNALSSSADLWRELIHPEDHSRVEAFFANAIKGHVETYEVEFRQRHAAGHYVPVLSRGYISRNDFGHAIRVSGTNTDLTERKLDDEKIQKLAFYDPLTNLPNRRLLTELLRKAVNNSSRNKQIGALLFIDLDNFKILNDTLGHDVGDLVIKEVAQRLTDCVRLADSVARLGGDEFLVVLETLGDDPQEAAVNARRRAERIQTALNMPYLATTVNYVSTASIGIALFDERDTSAEVILKHADLAMYHAKSAGRDTLRFFDQAMQTAADERLALERDLRQDLQTDRIRLYFQPQVDHAGNIVGAEALARWFHAKRGMIAPDIFIPLAEASGLIQKIGDKLLRSACRQLASWAEDERFSHLRLSVNVSVKQFSEADFVDKLMQIIADTGADPGKLRLEVTESLLAGDIEDIIEKMALLRMNRISFSLDDFGTGYSSLKYLQRMPFDELKIDRAFVHELPFNKNAATIARVIISLAENMGIEIIAEGVETDLQRQFLEENRCAFYQGFLFSRALPLHDFETLGLPIGSVC